MPQRANGFTLLELMIVVAVIAIIASIAVPNLLSGRVAANEGAAIATLRSIATAQFQFKSSQNIDRNNDQNGEFGGLAELTGVGVLRGSTTPLVPALLSPSLGAVDAQGRVLRQGYLFAVFLPDATGAGAPDTAAGLATVDARLAEDHWTVLAWPVQLGQTGRSTYFMNQLGDPRRAARASYSGTASVPPAGAGLVGVAPNTIVGGVLASEAVGADGNTWLPVR